MHKVTCCLTVPGTASAEPAVEATLAPPITAPDLPPVDSDSGSLTEDEQPSETTSASSDSSSSPASPAASPRRKKHKGSRPDNRASTIGAPPAFDYLHPGRVPIKSTQPPPPRRLKLPTVATETLRRLRNRVKVVDVEEILHPRPFGGRSEAAGPVRATSTADYLRGVGIIIAYRTYFFPPLAVQWAMYNVWLQSHAAGLSVAALRALDGQGRTHLAQYPEEYHSAAELSESVQGLQLGSSSRQQPPAATRQPVTAANFMPQPYRREPCIRWNSGRCLHGYNCRRTHACATCGGPHQARSCRLQPGNGPRPLAGPPAGRF